MRILALEISGALLFLGNLRGLEYAAILFTWKYNEPLSYRLP
ncbi:MAG TPA: hypothetical protein VLB04_12125 [Methanotrichaceae archaeon]|nr:hypothetical protein [Methanotrichaceae archaeon]